jgi:hypothetical protein
MEEQLPTIAEIAVVITGFAGLVLAVRPDTVFEKSISAIWLRLLTLQTFLLLFLALIPGFLESVAEHFAINPWYWANAIMAVAFFSVTAWRFRKYMQGGRNAHTQLSFYIATGLYLMQVALCTAHLFGFAPEAGIPIYLLGILLNLFTSCYNFYLLLFTDSGR